MSKAASRSLRLPPAVKGTAEFPMGTVGNPYRFALKGTVKGDVGPYKVIWGHLRSILDFGAFLWALVWALSFLNYMGPLWRWFRMVSRVPGRTLRVLPPGCWGSFGEPFGDVGAIKGCIGDWVFKGFPMYPCYGPLRLWWGLFYGPCFSIWYIYKYICIYIYATPPNPTSSPSVL